MIIKGLYEVIGNTPLLELDCNFYAKLEYLNPSGSIKDRATYRMIRDYDLKNKSVTIIEPTSGNLGISVSMICASLGYNSIIVMPKSVSLERIKMIKAYGGKIVLTNNMKDAVEVAMILKDKIDNSILLGQFDNYSNVAIHYETTGPEILKDISDIDYLICGIGTGGTVTGCGLYLKENTNCQIIGVLPSELPHKIQGIGAGFKPKILKEEIIDEVVTITDDEAILGFKRLNSLGIPSGISSGAIYMVGLNYHKNYPDKKIVMIFPDGIDRYLSVFEE